MPLSKVFDLQGMGILKENEKNYLKSFTSDTQILIPLAGGPPDQNKLKKVDKFIAKNYPVSLLRSKKNILIEYWKVSKNKI